MRNPKELSVVVTVYNEQENIAPLIQQVDEALRDIDYELILVDDGSTDRTREEVRTYAHERVRMVELRKNYGQSTAMTAGIDEACGRFIALMDGDLQNDPRDIPMMLHKLKKEEWDVVAGNRKNRQDGMLLRKIPSKLANALIRHQTGVHIRDYGCTLKVFRSEYAKDLGIYGELHRFIPVLASLKGAKITQVDVLHHPRRFGTSKYGINRTFKVTSDLILILFFQKYMQKPMHLFGGIGLLSLLPGFLILAYLFVIKIMGQDIGNKPLLTLGVLLILTGIIFVVLGIIAELLIRIYFNLPEKKQYSVKRIFPESEEA